MDEVSQAVQDAPAAGERTPSLKDAHHPEVKGCETEVKGSETEVKGSETEVKGSDTEVKGSETEVKGCETENGTDQMETLDTKDERLEENGDGGRFGLNNAEGATTSEEQGLKQGAGIQAPLVHAEPLSASASPRHGQPVQEYHLKWINWNDRQTPIVTQNENGPCPLIAVINVLLLRNTIEIPTGVQIVTATQLFNYLGNALLQQIPKDATEAVRKNFEKNMSDAMEIVSKLQTGLDVNVRFTGVSDFEYTQECLIFDLLNINLYHGWLYDPQNVELVCAVGTCSYNQLVEQIIENKGSSDAVESHQGLVAESFLQSSAAQLTYHGLCELNATIKNNQLCVLFRNNHFSTVCKHDDILYILVTDQGFLTASCIFWESLSNVEGDSLFYDGNFERCVPNNKPAAAAACHMSPEQQIDSDFLVALSIQEDQETEDKEEENNHQADLSGLTDQELAMRLQQEEDMQAARLVQEQEQSGQEQQGGGQGGGAAAAGQQRPPDGARHPQQQQQNGAHPQQRPARRDAKDKNCSIL